MVRIIASTCFIALFWSPAIAKEPGTAAEPQIMLWNGLHTATTKAQLKAYIATLPGKRVELAPGCRAQLVYRFIKDRLVTINLMGINKEAACSDILLTDLTREYGEAKSATGIQATGPFSTGSSVAVGTISRQDHVWQADGRRILLSVIPGKPSSYNLIFTVRPEKYLW
jgi:hypothetical protein